MERNILNKLETPVILVDNKEVIAFENTAARHLLGGGESIVGRNVYDAIHCMKDVCEFDFETVFKNAKELFDATTGIYWRAHVQSFEDNGKKMVLIQFLNINMQKMKARKLYSGYVFPGEVQEQIEEVFDSVLNAEFSRSHRRGNHFSLILYSLDDITGFIEKHGLEQTNLVLNTVGETWVSNIRDYDYSPYYLNRNLFAVLLPDVKKDMAKQISEKIYRKIKEKVDASLSFGIADSSDTPSSANLLTLVERALYVAQQRGGDTIAIG